MLKSFFICAVLAVPAAAAKTSYEPLPAELRELSRKGLDAVYAVTLPEAQKYFDEAVKKYPAHPFGHFGAAMVKWAHFEYLEDESDPALDKEYEALTDKAIDVGDKWLKKHPGDANAHMCIGGMHGLRARLALLQHRWIKAYFEGRKALSHTRKALELDPELYDAYLGLGMYEYYAGTLSGVVKILARFFMKGDAEEGLKYLNLCREKGYFNSTAAKLILIEIYTQTDSKYADPKTAVKWSRELRAKYPDHAQMHFVEIVSLFENRQYAESRASAEDYLRRLESGDPVYRPNYLPRILVALGTIYLVEHDYQKGLEKFLRARQTLKKDPDAHPTRWAVWAVVRAGHALDLQGLRDKSREYYREALSYKDEWGFGDYIKPYFKNPFEKTDLPGSLPPP
ncbi:MAG TPA: hypothetical protein DDW67_09585 [Elusimicrobia bacterium]|nr:hypothetical protein [Elusimicrobiota bacterium]